MEIRQLKYFLAVIDFGSISKASNQLNVAQPAISQQIMNLEHELKTQLLMRSARGVTPTPAGQRLYRHARNIIAQIELAQTDISGGATGAVVGNVIVGLPTSTAAVMALPLLEQVRREFPGIKLRIIESLSGHLLELLMKNKVDLAVQFREDQVTGVQVDPILREELFLVTNNPAGVGQEVTATELEGLPMALPGYPSRVRELFDDYCRNLKVSPAIIADVDSLPALRGIASSGMAHIVLPWGALMHPQAPDLYLRPFAAPGLNRPVSLCYPHGTARNEATLIVQKICRNLMRELASTNRWSSVRLCEHRPAD